jgi:hypothetical protein
LPGRSAPEATEAANRPVVAPLELPELAFGRTAATGRSPAACRRQPVIAARLDGTAATRLAPGSYTFVVTDSSRTQDFGLSGPGVSKRTSLRGTGRSTWTVTLRRGTYVFQTGSRR